MKNISHKIFIKKSKKHGIGLFAKEDIFKGEFLGKFNGKRTSKEGIHVLWTSDKSGIIVDSILKYSNHNWETPNSEIINLKFYAIKDIKKNEEITWDYSCGYKYETKINKNKLFDNIGLSVLHHSILDNNINVFRSNIKLIKGLSLKNNLNNDEVDLIHWIGAFGNSDFFDEFFKYNKRVDIKSKNGKNILNYAYLYENYSLIAHLINVLPNKKLKKLFMALE